MKSIALLSFVASVALADPCQAATYSFTGFFGETLPPGQTDYTATFDFTLPGVISLDTEIAASSMSDCSTHASACVGATFYMDAAAAGLDPEHPDWQAIALSTSSVTTYYYFEAPAFAVPGVHASVGVGNPGTLTVSPSAVPEPGSPGLMLSALGLLLGVSTSLRRRDRASPALGLDA